MSAVRMSANNLVGHNNEPGHDKVYIACVRKVAAGFKVYGKWGKRGGGLKELVRGTYPNFNIAMRQAEALFEEKKGRGYVDIESPHYHGPVTFGSVRDFLEDDCGDVPSAVSSEPEPVKVKGKSRAIKSPQEFDVVCENNTGIEKHFDVDMSYTARETKDIGLLEVMDVHGEWIEALRSRFKCFENA